MNEKLKKMLERLREPSSKVGMSILFALFGAPAGLPDAISLTAAALLALWGVITPEKPAGA